MSGLLLDTTVQDNIQKILRLIPSQLSWCDRASLCQLMADEVNPLELDQALRYLTRKNILMRAWVNLPLIDLVSKLSDDLQTIDVADLSSAAKQLQLLSREPTEPTEMFGASRLWAGIEGQPFCLPLQWHQWLAYLRLSRAFTETVCSGNRLSPWKRYGSANQHSKLLLASHGQSLIVVPVQPRARLLARLLPSIQRWKGSYVLW
jgi:hypothetical protein